MRSHKLVDGEFIKRTPAELILYDIKVGNAQPPVDAPIVDLNNMDFTPDLNNLHVRDDLGIDNVRYDMTEGLELIPGTDENEAMMSDFEQKQADKQEWEQKVEDKGLIQASYDDFVEEASDVGDFVYDKVLDWDKEFQKVYD